MVKSLAQLQQEFTQHLRRAETPANGVDTRAMSIYGGMVYRNIEEFLAGFFPVARSLLNNEKWHDLVRQFIRQHHCKTPYFLEISQEFLQFLMQNPERLNSYPSFFLELCHYEWVELALDISTEVLPPKIQNADNRLGFPQVSALAWGLSYQYPVHQIGLQNPAPEPALTHLIVCRNRQHQVNFLQANALTLRLFQLLQTHLSGHQACMVIAAETAHSQPEQLWVEGDQLITQLLELEIIVAINNTPAQI